MKKLLCAFFVLLALAMSPLALAEDASTNVDTTADTESVSDASVTAANTANAARISGAERLRAQQVAADDARALQTRTKFVANAKKARVSAIAADKQLKLAARARSTVLDKRDALSAAKREYTRDPSLSTVKDLCSRYAEANLEKIAILLDGASDEETQKFQHLSEDLKKYASSCRDAVSEQEVKERITELRAAYTEQKNVVSERAIAHYLELQQDRLITLQDILARLVTHFEENENDAALEKMDALLTRSEGFSKQLDSAFIELKENGRSRQAFNDAKVVRNGLHELAKDVRSVVQRLKQVNGNTDRDQLAVRESASE